MGICGAAQGERKVKQNKTIKLNETENAILECKKCRDKIKQYIRRLSQKQLKSREKAKDLVRSKQKDRAKVYLRMAKLHGEQIKVSEGQSRNAININIKNIINYNTELTNYLNKKIKTNINFFE